MNQRAYFYDLLNIFGLVGEGVAITKDASFFSTFKIRPFDLAFEPHFKMEEVVNRLNQSFRFLNDGWVIYFDALRSQKKMPSFPFDENAPSSSLLFDEERRGLLSFYKNDFYLTILYRVPDSKNKSDFFFGGNKKESMISQELFKFEDITHKMTRLLANSFVEVEKLNSLNLLRFYHSLYSKDHPINTPPMGSYLDSVLDDIVYKADNVVQLNDEIVLCSAIHNFPDRSMAGMFTRLFDAPYSFRYSMRFEYMSRDTAKKSISAIRNSQMQKRKGAGGMIMEALTSEPPRVEDPEAVNLSNEAIDAEGLLSSGQVGYGYMTTNLIVRSRDFEKANNDLKELMDIVNEQGFICKQETVNNPLAFLGSIPGNLYYDKRKHLVNTFNIAHLFCLSDAWVGDYENPFFEELTGNSSPHMITKSTNNPFFLNLNVGDVGHCVITGPTGAGKSILLNALSFQFERYPSSQIIFFDKDKSSQYSCRNTGGQFFDLFADGSDFKLNPFSNIGLKSDYQYSEKEKKIAEQACKNKRFWLCDFFVDFFKSKNLSVSADDKNQVLKTLDAMATNMEHGSFEDFKNSIQKAEYRDALEPYISGTYSTLFTHEDDSFDNNRFTCFEMNHLMDMGGEIVSFVLFYLFYKIELLFDGNHPVLLVLDECWLFFSNPVFANKLKDWLKVLRKKKVFVVMATQEINDSKTSPIFSTVVNACLTKIFLPNPTASQPVNRELYYEMGLSDGHIDTIEKAVMKRDYLYFSPKGCQLFSLDLTKKQVELLTSYKEV